MMDLLLGGEVGSWALTKVNPIDVGRVFTADESLAAQAWELGFDVTQSSVREYSGDTAAAVLSVHYPRILSENELSRWQRAYNLHPGLLPFGRGFYPVFWALWEGTPAGATLHHMTAAVDSGPVVDQIEVSRREDDTGGSLLARVREAERTVFTRNWDRLRHGEDLPSRPQQGRGTYHSRAEFMALRDHADLESMTGAEVLRLARSLDVPGYPGLAITSATPAVRWRLVREDA